MTNIQALNFEFAQTSCEVSISPDGIGFDVHDVSTGDWLGTVDDLQEAESFLMSIEFVQFGKGE